MPDIVAASMQPALRVHRVQSPARNRLENCGSSTGRWWREEPTEST
jgi:hypothetical protein